MAFVWEQRKLGEVAKYRNGKAHENCIDDDGKYIVVNSKFVSTNGKVKKFSNMQNEPLFENEVAFVLSDVPNGRAIARTFLVEKSDKYTLNQRIAGITPLNETDPYYLHVLMNRHPYFLAFDDGVKQTNLSVSDVMKFESYYPKYEEQETIGRCFSQLDQLITLHQRKRMLRRCFFSIDWEQRKLGDITESYSGGTPTAGKKEYYDGNIPFIRSGEISSDKTELFISEEGLNRSSAKMVKIGDILYALYGATSGEVSISKLKGAINQAILAIQPHQNYDSQFLMQWLRKSKENIIGTYLQGGQGNLSGNIVKELIIDIPTYEEQKEIGAYLKKLDHLITLHQCKSNFCKKNEVNAWEQRKFVEFVKNAAKKNKDNIDLEPYAVTNDRGFIAQKDAHDDFGYMSNVDRTAYNIVPPNSFAYNPARINVGSLGYYEGTENVIVSSLYEVFQTEEYIDDKFLLHWFKSDSFPRWIEKLQEGSVRLYFYFDKLVQCQMMVPSLEEQKRISAYLDSIDQLITLHQWECNINENTEGNDEKQRKPIKKLIISEGNLSLVDDMFLLHRMTFLVCNKYILLRLNVVKYKITIIIISNILYSIVSLLIIACYLIVINKQLIILIYVEISVVIIKGDDDYARIRS